MGKHNATSAMTEREEFIFRCLNAAANFYGVLTISEFKSLFDGYAEKHSAPIAGALSDAELEACFAKQIDADEKWFHPYTHPKTGTRYLVAPHGFVQTTEQGVDVANDKAIDAFLSMRLDCDMKILPESVFLDYEDPIAFEETPETKAFAKYLRKKFGLSKLESELYVWDVQCVIRTTPTLHAALEFLHDDGMATFTSWDDVDEIMDMLEPVARITPVWKYFGHNAKEMVHAGLINQYVMEDFRDIFDFSDEEDDDYDDEIEDKMDWPFDQPAIDLTNLPPAAYPSGPIDFSFVKDQKKRDRALDDYRRVRQLTQDFVRMVVMRELKDSERRAAAKRLGVEDATGREAFNLDMATGDFASMMDDQSGEPAIRRILKRKAQLEEKYQLAAAYYENYRYTWLVVEAVKAGIGVKCRNLFTGESLFLMETAFSQSPNIKGCTICAGIAPMGNVYLALGVLHHANFDNPDFVLKVVLNHLNIPFSEPLTLSFKDQARLAAETIRRVYSLGHFDDIIY